MGNDLGSSKFRTAAREPSVDPPSDKTSGMEYRFKTKSRAPARCFWVLKFAWASWMWIISLPFVPAWISLTRTSSNGIGNKAGFRIIESNVHPAVSVCALFPTTAAPWLTWFGDCAAPETLAYPNYSDKKIRRTAAATDLSTTRRALWVSICILCTCICRMEVQNILPCHINIHLPIGYKSFIHWDWLQKAI